MYSIWQEFQKPQNSGRATFLDNVVSHKNSEI